MQNSTFPRVSRRNFDDEIVEDSEPEREALRQTQKQERKKRKLVQLAGIDSPAKVVFISDGSAPPSPATAPSRLKVIDISDIDSSQNISVNQNVISLSSSAAGTNPNSAAPHIVEVFRRWISHALLLPILAPFNLEILLQLWRRPLAAIAKPNHQRKGPRGVHLMVSLGNFLILELRKLVKCVSCDIAWTARKSAAQKLVHSVLSIRSCGKKNGFTDDTMRHLIRKELDSMPDEPGPSNRNGKAPLVPTERTTLLEDVVRDAAPKRKGKRKAAVDILKSARGIPPMAENFVTADPGYHSRCTLPLHNRMQLKLLGQADWDSSRGTSPCFWKKQDSDDEGELNFPPATQAFAPSKLGTRITSLGWGYESESEDDAPAPKLGVSSPQTSRNPFDPPLFHASSIKEASQKSSPKPRKIKTRDKPISDGGNAKSPQTKRRIEAPAGGNESPRPTSPIKPKRTRKKAEDQYDERWELGLKEKIVQDRDLHLRILRYEVSPTLPLPISILTPFQAINFYGGEVTKRRRR
ncbi:hypothetical protein DFH06DRAFT_1119843 [Mycena polygramma]|nr:hypothetical protein DFH06DRAFT_1119843 [Mycena polygramma]